METDQRWTSEGISGDTIREKAAWIAEKRNLHGRSLAFFDIAGRLLLHAETDYLLISPVFFHAILGLESALKLHYRTEMGYLKELFRRGIDDGLVTEKVFHNIRPLSKKISQQLDRDITAHHEKLAALIPEWRNQYFHGGFLLMPDYFYLSLQLREIADVLTTSKKRAAGRGQSGRKGSGCLLPYRMDRADLPSRSAGCGAAQKPSSIR